MVRLARLADRMRAVTVLFVSYAGFPGGAERLLLDAASALDEPPTLACPDGPLAAHAGESGLHVLSLRQRPLELRARRAAAARDLLGMRVELDTIVRALRPTVLCAWGMRALFATATIRGRHRLLFQHNDLMPGPAIARAVRLAARRADVIVTASECIARELGLPGAHVIHPGVDLARFDPAPPPAGPRDVLVLGAIEPWKRPDLSLEIAARCPDVRLRLAGAPISAAGEELLARLRDRATRPDLAGRVEFAGRQDAAEALAHAHCLLHCAEREPYGIVLAEALAAGRPVVAPASCGPLEIVDDTCGRLYEPGDVEHAANALLEVLDHAEELGSQARQRAEQHFSVENTRANYRKLLPTPETRHPTLAANLALVTVTHNSESDIRRLLASVQRHLPDARVIVVDSGSSDASAEVASAAGAHVIELDENVGFGRASNIGIAQVARPVTVVANPDVELVDGSLAQLADELHNADRIVAPLVLLPDGSRQDSAQAEPGSTAALAIALVPPALMPPRLRHATCPWTSNKPRRVGWAIGACLAARTQTLKRLGPFDERIFLYAEDLDFCLRAADAGVETWFCPQARVIHRGAHSTEAAFGGEAVELLAAQRQQVLAERRGVAVARRDKLLQAITFADRIMLKTLAARSTERERKQLGAVWRQ